MDGTTARSPGGELTPASGCIGRVTPEQRTAEEFAHYHAPDGAAGRTRHAGVAPPKRSSAWSGVTELERGKACPADGYG
jgi:hypothetical protein